MGSYYFVSGSEHEENNPGKLYQMIELHDALVDFMHRVSTDEEATLKWSS